ERQVAIETSRRTIAHFRRQPHYRDLYAQEGFSREAAAHTDAWKQKDGAGGMPAVRDERVLTLSASGTADDASARVSALFKAGLKQAVLFPLAVDGDASGAILRTIEALS